MAGALLVGSISVTAFAQSNQYSSGQHKGASSVYLEIDDDIENDWTKEVRITPEKALKIVQNFQSGIIKEWKLDEEDDLLVYKAEVKTHQQEIDVYVDAVTGKVWRDDKNKQNDQKNQKVKISVDQAKKIALAQVKGSIKEIKLDEDDDQYIYEVEMKTDKGQEVEMEISATTGAVLDIEWDD